MLQAFSAILSMCNFLINYYKQQYFSLSDLHRLRNKGRQRGRNMSNEELAIRVKNGDADATLLLWNAVERFIIVMAEKYSFANEKAAETEDLINSGYFAVCKAAKAFEPERGTTFLTLLGYYLKNTFADGLFFDRRKLDLIPKVFLHGSYTT